MKEPLARIHVSPTQQRAAELFAFFADAIQFLGRTAWPVVDLIVRFWIAMPAIVSGLLMANDWNTALMLAINEYPIPWLAPRTEALLGIVVQLAGGISPVLWRNCHKNLAWRRLSLPHGRNSHGHYASLKASGNHSLNRKL